MRTMASGRAGRSRPAAMGTFARSRVYRTWTAADATVTLGKGRDPLLVYRPES